MRREEYDVAVEGAVREGVCTFARLVERLEGLEREDPRPAIANQVKRALRELSMSGRVEFIGNRWRAR